MTSRAPDWLESATAFLTETLPRDPDRPGWSDKAISSYEAGCEALVALGVAEKTTWGAAPQAPITPENLPRWDDLCAVVLGLAVQNNLLSFQTAPSPHQGSGRTMFNVTRLDGAPAPPPNLVDAHGGFRAFATPHLLDLLERLGLVSGGTWNAAAEDVLWRMTEARKLVDFSSNARFLEAAQLCAETLPIETRQEIEGLMAVSDTDIADHIARAKAAQEKTVREFGPNARLDPILSEDQAKRTVEWLRKEEINRLFCQKWRINDGWLSGTAVKAALGLFNDPLAQAIRQSVLKTLWPDAKAFHT
ncbi:hypothetical protein [uncultured Celeribacter sp.]|uniref:hypothetical protein n=1 Tax=uncultured Celeribacter sp. TaxID=1303376 RepID=UPI002AA71280|nr:hypothetical protein [uncultured Celeribacter sp.]